jgi:hypothetical protein
MMLQANSLQLEQEVSLQVARPASQAGERKSTITPKWFRDTNAQQHPKCKQRKPKCGLC